MWWSRWHPRQGWLAVALLAVGQMAVVRSVQDARYVDGLDILTPLVLGAMLLALVLTRLPLHATLQLGLGGVAGAWASIAAVASTLPAGAREERLREVAHRLIAWWHVIHSGELSTDSLPFLLGVVALAWLIAFVGLWWVERTGTAWLPLLAAGTMLIVNLTYVIWLLPYLFVFLIAGMVLVVRLNLVAQERGWRAAGVRYSWTMPWRLLWYAVPASVAAVAFAWHVPLLSGNGPAVLSEVWSYVESPFLQWETEFGRLFAGVRSQGRASVSGYGTTMTLRGPVSLGNSVVLYLSTDQTARYLRAVVYERYTGEGWVAPAQRISIDLGKSEERWSLLPEYNARQELTQTIRVVQPKGNLLFAASLPLRASVGAQAEIERFAERARVRVDLRQAPEKAAPAFRAVAEQVRALLGREDTVAFVANLSTGDTRLPQYMLAALRQHLRSPVELTEVWLSNGQVVVVEMLAQGGGYGDIAVLRASGGVRRGMQYTVSSSVSVADADSLRLAGTNYPAWVIERYLQLPPTISERVRVLAQTVTAGKKNAYDKAVAVEAFLRRLAYNEEIPGPPPGREGVDWFLFDMRQGYCDYYASAMAVMLRAVGVPTRVAAGYNLGDYDAANNAYTIRESNAHSWPEVFFPGYGWTEFEPTPSRPTFERGGVVLASDAIDDADGGSLDGDIPPGEMLDANLAGDDAWTLAAAGAALPWGQLLLALLAIAGLALATLVLFWFTGLRGLSPVTRAYGRITWLARWLGRAQRPAETPMEFATAMATLVPERRQSLVQIATAYARTRFARRSATPTEAAALEEAWRALRSDLARELVRQGVVRRWLRGRG
ncbi:MAG: transglutaminase domain-containing protein [Chloroflexi bacterium]|nr:transglutaminase domain-containing protein [Chloroflexota bacterium]